MALGNMTHAISMFSDGKGGLQRFTTKKHLLKIYGMVRHLLCLHAGRHCGSGQSGSAVRQATTSNQPASAQNACLQWEQISRSHELRCALDSQAPAEGLGFVHLPGHGQRRRERALRAHLGYRLRPNVAIRVWDAHPQRAQVRGCAAALSVAPGCQLCTSVYACQRRWRGDS